ncbi:hypothetical protein PENVUL_c012G07872 [Penicillium vulpinum]|uniref:Uncharacterized protein n=1 Tax=Penicillium vulpinum TaxID=29845 RepID=A0A1V6S1T5_9EURO|nr:hypothetical protein PENVUL_c012G07872 [Penicillium vulpinum]
MSTESFPSYLITNPQIKDLAIGLQWLETLDPSLIKKLRIVIVQVKPVYRPGWPAFLNKLSTEAVGLEELDVQISIRFSAANWCAAVDIEFLRELGRFRWLKRMKLDGWFPREWPEYLLSRTGLTVWRESEHTEAHLRELRKFRDLLIPEYPSDFE